MVHIIDAWVMRDLEQHSSSCNDYIEKPGVLGRPKRHLESEEYFDLPGTFWKPLQQLEIDPLECLRELQRRRMCKHSGELSCRQLPCRSVLDKQQERAIEELWDSFRAIFGLPPLCTVEPFQP
ncbi:uncharacterized protein STEHIDRAFT_134172 [Stereum hirsutum FP-91666 SS1]|uniref:uncharacterized protein n=1 Tax=Stereum hirsutum (strain FP-91666) TaxID=721885 RepID=UPI000444A2E3|nr:uncharacterized protein STEHIDRAFT_134172 [Stereum hirsutum FP-91666 SS1]EIM81843.1 hypothetical protein STEHIDRAFT_134172 [Stereum hirsutum FP-91666 SS1]